jgi:hypothetical protein
VTDAASEPAPAPTAEVVARRRAARRRAGAVRQRLGGLLHRAGAARIGRGWPVAGGVVTFAWVAVALAGGDGSPVDTTASGAAAAAGTAALVGASWRPRAPQMAAVAFVVLLVLPVTVAAASAGDPLPLAAALVAFAAVEYVHRAVAAGCALLVASLVAARMSAGAWVLPGDGGADLVLALAGAALSMVGAATGPHRVRPLVAPAVLLGTAAVASTTPGAVPVLAAALAVAAAVLVGDRPSVALATLAVGAAAVPVAPAWGLLAAAAVLGSAVPGPAAVLLGLPGAAALADGLVPPGGGFAGAALMAGAVGVAVAVARRPGGRWSLPVGDGAAVPALVLGVWLVLAPGTWRWAGGDGLGPYDRGVAVAAAAAFLALLGTGLAALGGVPLDDVVEPPAGPGRSAPLRRAHARRRWRRRPSASRSPLAARHRPASSRRRRGDEVTPPPAPKDAAAPTPAPAPMDAPDPAPTDTSGPALTDPEPTNAAPTDPAPMDTPPTAPVPTDPERPDPGDAAPEHRAPPADDPVAEPAAVHQDPAIPEAVRDDEADDDVGPVVVVRPPGDRRLPPTRGGSPRRR